MTQQQQITEEQAKIWKQRWDSFLFMWDQANERLDRLTKYYESKKESRHPLLRKELSMQTLRGLLQRLRVFSKQHFAFFYNGLTGNPLYAFDNLGDLSHTSFEKLQSEYSVGEYILTTIIDLAVHDLLIIDQAIDQRFMAVTTVDWSGPESYQSGLRRNLSLHRTINYADELAIGGLSMFNNTFGFQRYTTAITYQRSSSNIRVIPYAPVALIGLPITTLGTIQDMLAIPHEIGHFLFWNGQRVQGEETVTFQELLTCQLQCAELNVNHPWLEEIVADVVSCLIGGPITAYSVQLLMQTVIGQEFLHDNGIHPAPAIRPYIYAHILEHKMRLASEAEMLRQSWHNVLGVNGRNILGEAASDTHTIQDLVDSTLQKEGEIFKLVSSVAELINVDENQTSLSWYQFVPTSDQSELIAEFIQLYESGLNPLRDQIRANLASHDKSINPDLNLNLDQEKCFWAEQVGELFDDVPEWLDRDQLEPYLEVPATVDDSQLEAEYVIPAIEWLTTFDAGGWTSGGGGPTNLKDYL